MEKYASMDHSTSSTSQNVSPLPAISFAAQQRRQRGTADWMPAGFDRYPATKALVESMPVVGMDGDPGYPLDRFTPPRENYG